MQIEILELASGAEEIITGSFVNAGAVIDYIRCRDPKRVSLVGMGNSGLRPASEDLSCAEYIGSALEGGRSDFEAMVAKIRNADGRPQKS